MIIYSFRRSAPTAQGLCRRISQARWPCVSQQQQQQQRRRLATRPPPSKPKSDALRILFCGSDAFSCESLKALYAEHQRNKELVESLEVMVLPDKKVGRGLKEVREVPCKALAEELGLQLHQRETFREWPLPEGINLVVVVSFRLFVPPRILASAKYGGLNVHPSLLPHLRGPAPIHHAILRGEPYTGVSLQTLDPNAFDHGTILAQTPAPGVAIPYDTPLSDLTHSLAVQGGNMLVQGLRDGVHVPPLENAGWAAPDGPELVHAPKITKADMQMDWTTWKADEIPRKLAVFGSVWTTGVVVSGKVAGAKKRVLFTRARIVHEKCVAALWGVTQTVTFMNDAGLELEVSVTIHEGSSSICYFQDAAGDWIGVERVKVDGSVEKDAADALKPFLRGEKTTV